MTRLQSGRTQRVGSVERPAALAKVSFSALPRALRRSPRQVCLAWARDVIASVPDHGVQGCDPLSRDGDDGFTAGFSGGGAAVFDGAETGVWAGGTDGGQVQDVAQGFAPAADAAATLTLAAVVGDGCRTGPGGAGFGADLAHPPQQQCSHPVRLGPEPAALGKVAGLCRVDPGLAQPRRIRRQPQRQIAIATGLEDRKGPGLRRRAAAPPRRRAGEAGVAVLRRFQAVNPTFAAGHIDRFLRNIDTEDALRQARSAPGERSPAEGRAPLVSRRAGFGPLPSRVFRAFDQVGGSQAANRTKGPKNFTGRRPHLTLSRDSLVGQRIWLSFDVQGLDGVVDGAVEDFCVSEGLMGEIMGFEVAPDGFDVAYVRARIWAATRRSTNGRAPRGRPWSPCWYGSGRCRAR